VGFLAAIGKWLGGEVVRQLLTKIIDLVKREIEVVKKKKENKEVVEEIKNAETEEDFKRAARRVAKQHDD